MVRYEIFCLWTTRFFISPDALYMFLTPKDKIRIYAEAIDAIGARGQRF